MSKIWRVAPFGFTPSTDERYVNTCKEFLKVYDEIDSGNFDESANVEYNRQQIMRGKNAIDILNVLPEPEKVKNLDEVLHSKEFSLYHCSLSETCMRIILARRADKRNEKTEPRLSCCNYRTMMDRLLKLIET